MGALPHIRQQSLRLEVRVNFRRHLPVRRRRWGRLDVGDQVRSPSGPRSAAASSPPVPLAARTVRRPKAASSRCVPSSSRRAQNSQRTDASKPGSVNSSEGGGPSSRCAHAQRWQPAARSGPHRRRSPRLAKRAEFSQDGKNSARRPVFRAMSTMTVLSSTIRSIIPFVSDLQACQLGESRLASEAIGPNRTAPPPLNAQSPREPAPSLPSRRQRRVSESRQRSRPSATCCEISYRECPGRDQPCRNSERFGKKPLLDHHASLPTCCYR